MDNIETESEFYETVGRMMRRARKRRGISPYYVARKMHVGWSLYMAFEKGMVPISAYHLYLFMNAISSDDFAKNYWLNIV